MQNIMYRVEIFCVDDDKSHDILYTLDFQEATSFFETLVKIDLPVALRADVWYEEVSDSVDEKE